jgi:hypothetical protein
MHELSTPWEGPFIVIEVVTHRHTASSGPTPRRSQGLEYRALTSLLSLKDLYQNTTRNHLFRDAIILSQIK